MDFIAQESEQYMPGDKDFLINEGIFTFIMEKMYYIGVSLTISVISNYSHSLCYYVIEQNGISVILFPQIWEKLIILLPMVEKIYNLECFSLNLLVTDDLSIISDYR